MFWGKDERSAGVISIDPRRAGPSHRTDQRKSSLSPLPLSIPIPFDRVRRVGKNFESSAREQPLLSLTFTLSHRNERGRSRASAATASAVAGAQTAAGCST